MRSSEKRIGPALLTARLRGPVTRIVGIAASTAVLVTVATTDTVRERDRTPSMSA
jgi:hypothetical protein